MKRAAGRDASQVGRRPWHIVTGEYPPAQHGVADYTRSVARGLAAAGDEVHVWTPASGAGLIEDAGVQLHPLARGFVPQGLFALSRDFSLQRRPRRVLLQYVPQAFGLRAMNVPFCAWIASLRDTQLWVMFHEVLVLWKPWSRIRRAPLAAATRAMATILARRADRSFVSVPAWEPLLRSVAPRQAAATWLPVPSNLPTEVPSEATAKVRARLHLGEDTQVVGHFGTYGSVIAPLLKRAASDILRRDPQRRLLLVGRGGDAFARDLKTERASADRVVATGELDASNVAAHLSACDVLVQPYADGVSTRRTSTMAGLALGIPVATNRGWLTEPIWQEARAVELASDPDGVAEAAETLLRDSVRAAALGERGRQLYASRFSMDHTVRALRDAESEGPP